MIDCVSTCNMMNVSIKALTTSTSYRHFECLDDTVTDTFHYSVYNYYKVFTNAICIKFVNLYLLHAVVLYIIFLYTLYELFKFAFYNCFVIPYYA